MAKKDSLASLDRYLTEDCSVATLWFTVFTVTVGATGDGGNIASFVTASFHKSEIVGFVATYVASFPCHMRMVYIL